MKIVNICGIDFEEYNSECFFYKKFILTVYCITYNHQKYIKSCLDGIVNQNTNFNFEVVIFDDASTDGTSDIIRAYCSKYPKLFHAYIAKLNTYSLPVRTDLSLEFRKNILKGDYVAFCEGDDYWIDSSKLQLQIDFLLKHRNTSLIVHNAYKSNAKNNRKELMVNLSDDCYVPTSVILNQHNLIFPTASFVGRKNIFYESFFLMTSGVQDWPILLYASTIGDVYYISKPMSIYRFLLEESWSNNNLLKQENRLNVIINCQELINRFNRYTHFEYNTFAQNRKALLWATVSDIFFSENDIYKNIVNATKKLKYYFDEYNFYFGIVEKIRNNVLHRYSINSYLSNYLKQVENKKLYVFCASTAGERMYIALKYLGLDIDCFIDNDESKNGMKFLGKNVVSYSYIKDFDFSDKVIQIASLDYDVQIITQLELLKGCKFISAKEFYEHFFAFDE